MSGRAEDAAVQPVARSDEELALAVDDHFRETVVAFGHVSPTGEAYATDHLVAAHCGRPSVFNRATALDLEQPDLAIGEADRFFGGLPHSLWLRSTETDADVDRLLRGRGYLPMPAVAGVARILPADELPVLDDHRITLLTEPSFAAGIADVASSGFGFGVEDRLAIEDLARNVLRHARPFQHGAVYGAYDEGANVVAMGLLLCTAEMAGLSTIATAPSHRHQGLATAIISRMLNDAAAHGYPMSGTVTNPESVALLADLGYHQVSSYLVYRQSAR